MQTTELIQTSIPNAFIANNLPYFDRGKGTKTKQNLLSKQSEGLVIHVAVLATGRLHTIMEMTQ